MAARLKDLAKFADGAVATRTACPSREIHEAIIDAAKLASTGFFPEGGESDWQVSKLDAYYAIFNDHYPQTKSYSPYVQHVICESCLSFAKLAFHCTSISTDMHPAACIRVSA